MTFAPPQMDGLLRRQLALSYKLTSQRLTALSCLLRRRLVLIYCRKLASQRLAAPFACCADSLLASGAGKTNAALQRLFSLCARYIIPPMPPPAGIGGSGSLMLATTDSVVSRVAATLVAFCKALLVTLAGSRMPALTISP